MDFETQAPMKKFGGGVFGDVYGILMLPKEIEIEKEAPPPPFELRFQVPDFRDAIKVSCFCIGRVVFG